MDTIIPEQLDLFQPQRWPRRPYCADDLSAGLRIRSLQQALTKPYIQANPPHLRVWSIFDVDRAGAAIAWEDANLPPPSWAATNRENAHAHLVWGLSAPVLVDGMGARDAPMRYLCAVEAAMREKLQADPGYSGLITKNPAHPLWRVLRGPQLSYELGELAEWLPDLDRFKPRRGVQPEAVGLGRNVTLFDRTRRWAYRAVRQYWGGGLDGWNAWLSAVNCKALEFNGDFQHPLQGNEVWHIAKSVSKWVWRHFTPQSFADLVARTHTSEVQQNRRLSDGRKRLIEEMDAS
ncbi:MAG: replication initiation protein [Fimbriimonadales bacterium]|nr:replication initiation protein [Fimbriimonadales bacterium]